MPEERARLKKRREDLGWKQGELADKVGTSQATISNLESGRHPQVYASVYAEILRVLKAGDIVDRSSERFKRVVERFLELDERDQETVASTIDTLTNLKKSRSA